MKKFVIILFAIFGAYNHSFAQCQDYCLNFEDTFCLSHLSIDTVAYPGNIWQIGRPLKPILNNAASSPFVIITDSINPYPVNNHSVFMIRNIADYGDVYGFRQLQGQYKVNSDSLNDHGLMEFSPDNGTTWVDMINDTAYSSTFIWWSPKPVLTGNSNAWQYFDVWLADIGSVFNIQFGDTLLFRFSFISDSTFDNADGLMYDNICFYQFVEGISETHYTPMKSRIYPNPSSGQFTIDFENTASEPYQLNIYTIHSKLVFTKDHITSNKIYLDSKKFEPGIYVYKLTKMNEPKRSWGKIIISK